MIFYNNNILITVLIIFKKKNTFPYLFSAPATPTTPAASANKKGGNLLKARPFKNRGRPKAKPVNIDTKNLEKVHRTVAGTDYDFEVIN